MAKCIDDVQEVKYGKNLAKEQEPCDLFICSECGIELEDWDRVKRKENGEVRYCNYVFKRCPECGAVIKP